MRVSSSSSCGCLSAHPRGQPKLAPPPLPPEVAPPPAAADLTRQQPPRSRWPAPESPSPPTSEPILPRWPPTPLSRCCYVITYLGELELLDLDLDQRLGNGRRCGGRGADRRGGAPSRCESKAIASSASPQKKILEVPPSRAALECSIEVAVAGVSDFRWRAQGSGRRFGEDVRRI
jgi:hypothetical protein